MNFQFPSIHFFVPHMQEEFQRRQGIALRSFFETELVQDPPENENAETWKSTTWNPKQTVYKWLFQFVSPFPSMKIMVGLGVPSIYRKEHHLSKAWLESAPGEPRKITLLLSIKLVVYNPTNQVFFIAQVDFSGVYHLIKDMFTKVEG